MSRFEDLKHIIKAKSSTLAAAKSQQIADSVNAQQGKNEQRKTGGGPPPPDFTPAEELALSNNAGRPLMVGVEGGSLLALVAAAPTTFIYREGLDDETLKKELFLPRSLGPRRLGPHHDK
ncbi:hypothetical protein NQZ68_017517 [Dissostichus eleginoides]|nr:hypothetical protein NQZ68_017517 [Dissostichus eleginoides]